MGSDYFAVLRFAVGFRVLAGWGLERAVVRLIQIVTTVPSLSVMTNVPSPSTSLALLSLLTWLAGLGRGRYFTCALTVIVVSPSREPYGDICRLFNRTYAKLRAKNTAPEE